MDTVDRCEHRIITAEMELKALMYVIDGAYGALIANIAAEYWIAELDTLDFSRLPDPQWRKCTICAISRLYKEGNLKRIVIQRDNESSAPAAP